MAQKAAVNPVTVMSMATISKLNQADAVNLFVEKTTTTSRAYMESAKLIVHIRNSMLPSQTVHGLLGKKGIRTSTINNAMQAVRVWDDLVVRKFVTEAQFDKLSYGIFVEINSAIKVKGATAIGALVAKGDFTEVEHIADHKETTAETKAKHDAKPKAVEPAKAPEKKPAKKSEPKPETTPDGEKVTTLTEPEKEGVTTLEVTPAKSTPAPEVTNIVQLPKKDVTLADGEATLDTLQNIFAELPENEFVALAAKLMVLCDLVVDKELQIRAKKAA